MTERPELTEEWLEQEVKNQSSPLSIAVKVAAATEKQRNVYPEELKTEFLHRLHKKRPAVDGQDPVYPGPDVYKDVFAPGESRFHGQGPFEWGEAYEWLVAQVKVLVADPKYPKMIKPLSSLNGENTPAAWVKSHEEKQALVASGQKIKSRGGQNVFSDKDVNIIKKLLLVLRGDARSISSDSENK